MAPKAPKLTCKNIASFIGDEFGAHAMYGNIAKNALNDKRIPKDIANHIEDFLFGMSHDEGEHNRNLFQMAEWLGCDKQQWFIDATNKHKVIR